MFYFKLTNKTEIFKINCKLYKTEICILNSNCSRVPVNISVNNAFWKIQGRTCILCPERYRYKLVSLFSLFFWSWRWIDFYILELAHSNEFERISKISLQSFYFEVMGIYLEFNSSLGLRPKAAHIIKARIREFPQISSPHVIYEKKNAIFVYG